MKPLSQLVSILTLFILASCEKVIDVSLDKAESKFVIEAVVTDQANKTQVKISKTKDYNASNDFEGVSGAVVTIEEEGGAISQFVENSRGSYTSDLKGIPGKNYMLKVLLAGKSYTAIAKMPQPVSIDSLFTESLNMGSGNKKYMVARYQDPVQVRNYYRFVQYVNGIKEKSIFIDNDDLTNGRMAVTPLFMHDGEVKTSDTVTIALQSIDANVYRYWYSLSRSALGANDAAPANPVTNIVGGALGYFSAHAVTEKTYIVK